MTSFDEQRPHKNALTLSMPYFFVPVENIFFVKNPFLWRIYDISYAFQAMSAIFSCYLELYQIWYVGR